MVVAAFELSLRLFSTAENAPSEAFVESLRRFVELGLLESPVPSSSAGRLSSRAGGSLMWPEYQKHLPILTNGRLDNQ